MIHLIRQSSRLVKFRIAITITTGPISEHQHSPIRHVGESTAFSQEPQIVALNPVAAVMYFLTASIAMNVKKGNKIMYAPTAYAM